MLRQVNGYVHSNSPSAAPRAMLPISDIPAGLLRRSRRRSPGRLGTSGIARADPPLTAHSEALIARRYPELMGQGVGMPQCYPWATVRDLHYGPWIRSNRPDRPGRDTEERIDA
jgi:hypothetical protein